LIVNNLNRSVAYMTPEILSRQGHTFTVDWYTLGLVIYEMLTGLPPFYANTQMKLFNNILKNQYTPIKDASRECNDLLSKLLIRNREKRLGNKGASEIKNHPWFQEIDWE
jgi:serine/threonine protein kinase